jgi:protein TonB
MNNPLLNFQQFGSGIPSPKEGNPARIFPFKITASEFSAQEVRAVAADFALGDFKFEPDSGDRKIIDYLILGALSILIHTAIFDQFKSARFEQEQIVEPVKIPPKVQISLVRPRPKPIIQPPPPPPKVQPKQVQKAVPLKPLKPKVKPKPVEKLVQPPPVQQPTTVTESRIPVTPAPPVAQPVEEKVTEPRAGADYLNNPSPEYPEVAMDRGWEGKVLMKVHVLASGRPDSVAVINSSGKTILDDAAVKTVKKWSFVPATRGKTPIAGWVTVPITFNLQS